MSGKAKGQNYNNEYFEFWDDEAIHSLRGKDGKSYTVALDENNGLVAVEKSQSTAKKIKSQNANGNFVQKIFDVDAIHSINGKDGNTYTLELDNQNNVVAKRIDVPSDQHEKVKGQRINGGGYQEFFDVDALHALIGLDGNEYVLFVDEDGSVETKRKPALVTEGLVKRYLIVDGRLIESVSNTDITPAGTTYENTFPANVLPQYNADFSGSVEIVAAGVASGRSIVRFTASGISDGRMGVTRSYTSAIQFKLYGSGEYRLCSGEDGDTLLSNSFGTNLFVPSYAPKLTAIPHDPSLMHAALENPFTHGLYYDMNGTQTNSKKRSVNGLIQHNSNEAYNIRQSVAEDGLKFNFANEKFPAVEIRFYNRMLTDSEIEQNAIFDGTHYSTVTVGRMERIYGGYAPFGGRIAMQSYKSVFPNTFPPKTETTVGEYVDGGKNSYTISALTPYAEPPRTDGGVFQGIKFISVPDKLYTFRKCSVVAMPYPLNGDMVGIDAGKFHVMYSSSDDSICECVDGVLIPKTEGTVTITARLAGSQLTDSFTVSVEVYNDFVTDSETLYLPENFSDGVHFLNSDNPQECALAMFYAIKTAGENNYRRIVFPKREYTIYPVFEYGREKICCIVPGNLIIDFSGSDIYIADNPMSVGDRNNNYLVFAFTEKCKFSAIKNAKFYGERTFGLNGRSERAYNGYCGLVNYNNCYMCGTDNVSFYNTVGHFYVFGTSGQWNWSAGYFDPNWSVGSGLAHNGRIMKDEFELGAFDANGEPIDSSDTIRTVCMMDIGYESSDLQDFTWGNMGERYYLVHSRWLRVWWYDSEKNLLNPGGTLYYQFSKYHLPAGAKYFKLSAYQSAIPTSNAGVDGWQCALRLYPYQQADYCYATHIDVANPNGWALTVTGGQHCYIGDGKFEYARKYVDGSTPTYAIDLEDNYFSTQSNVFDNCLIYGIKLFGGIGHAMLSCTTWGTSSSYHSTLVKTDMECTRIMNSVLGSFYKSAKFDTVYRGNMLTTTVDSAEAQGSLIETDVSSTGTNNLNNY